MKLLIVVCLGVGVFAEPGLFQRQEEANAAPYPASGYRPSRQFLLPSERQNILEPKDPRTFFGYPEPDAEATTTENSITTTDSPTTTDSAFTTPTNPLSPASSQLKNARALPDSDVEEVEDTNEQKNSANDGEGQQGIYYVLLPTGQLQRVEYLTRVDDVQRMAYTAQLKYADVQPITGPIYAYDPKTSFLQIIA